MERELIPAIIWNFLDNLREGVIVVYPNGSIEYMNDAAYTALGLDINREYLTLPDLLPPYTPAAIGHNLLQPPFITHLTAAGQPVEIEACTLPEWGDRLLQIIVRPLPTAASSPFPAEYLANPEQQNELPISTAHLKTVLHITSELSASLDHDWVLMRALEMINDIVNATQGVILLIDEESGQLVFRASLGKERQLSPQGLPTGMMPNEGLAGWIITHQVSTIVHDTHQDTRWIKRATSQDHRSVLAVPLISNEAVIGVLMLFQSKPNAFTKSQLDLVETAAVQVANAISNANLYQLIRQQAERLGTMLRLEQIETAKNQAILESIADGVIVADAQHKIILANLSASTILGLPRRQLIDLTIEDLLEHYDLTEQSWIPTVADWTLNSDHLEHLEEQLSIDDKIINVRVSPVLVGRQLFGTVSIFRDVTKEAEVDRLKSEFVSTVSHELRTPMTSIQGFVDLMLLGMAGQMSPVQMRYLRIIKNNAGRLQILVDDLLNISHIETGKVLLNLQPINLASLVEKIVAGHIRGRIQHEEKDVVIKTKLPDTLPLVSADEARIMQVLTNLLDNALNYTNIGDEIEISAYCDGDSVCVNVADNGIGIAEEEQQKIFDRFYRANNTTVQKIPGTGLGLSIVHSIVTMHGGQMQVISKLGQGSTFRFNLPIAPESEANQQCL
ncbi:MAG: ATP-binding protein [Chloroflexota bacterium]